MYTISLWPVGIKQRNWARALWDWGAFTSVVGDAGVTVAERLDIPVTTGDSYTVVMAVEAILEAARVMEIPINEAHVAVVGASGAIGKTCAELLVRECGQLTLVGRRREPLEVVRELCKGQQAEVMVSTETSAVYHADLILTVTSALDTVIEPQHLKPGAVVLDVARPRDVSPLVAAERDDVLVIEGGMVEVPGAVNFNFDLDSRLGSHLHVWRKRWHWHWTDAMKISRLAKTSA